MKYLIVITIALVFTGCMSSQLTATPDSVSYKYNQNFGSPTTEAEAHCQKFGKHAELRSSNITSSSGNWLTEIYDCK